MAIEVEQSPRQLEEQEIEHHTNVRLHVVHEAVVRNGEHELRRSNSSLAWSGLAAGLSMGLSFIACGILRSALPESTLRPLLVQLGYPLGFLAVILARQQLFTENTLTGFLPLLARRNWETAVQVARLWAIVLTSNLVGAIVIAWVLGNTPVFRPEVQQSFLELGNKAMEVSFGTAVLRGIFAGWIIALLVWILAAMESHSVAIIIILTYLVGAGGFTHIIAGSIESLFLVVTGHLSWLGYVTGYMLPTLIGNVIGGVSLVSALNHAQVVSGEDEDKPDLGEPARH
jgi:formate/nitrite transporter FocA (FNT family)